MSELKVDKVSPRTGNYVALNTVGSKNIVINGDMSIAQRGTSESGVTTTDYYTCDRWNFSIGSLGTWTISQDTDVPTGQGFATSLKLDCTTADAAPSSTDSANVQQRIEGQMLQYLKKGTSSAESLTCSFWVKSNKTGTYTCELRDFDNSRTISKTYTIDSSNTWEKKTVTFAGDTTGAFDNDNARSLDINWWIGAGTDFTSGTLATSWQSIVAADRVSSSQVNLADSTANEWYITGVQLEAGTTASDFEFLPVDVNLQRCQRYLPSIKIKTYTAGGICFASDDARTHFQLPVRARTAPTGITYDGTITFQKSNGASTGTGIAFTTATEDFIQLIDVGASGLTAGNSTGLGTDSSNTRTILCTGCEL